jgi:hypothetical protein
MRVEIKIKAFPMTYRDSVLRGYFLDKLAKNP